MDRENLNRKHSLKDEFCVWSEIGNTSVEKELSEEYILPDYLPDIRKILFVKASTADNEVFVSDGKAEIEGKVLFNVIYLGDTGEVRCISREYSFGNIANVEGIYEESSVEVTNSVKNKSVRALSPRKLLIKGKAVSDVKVYNKLCVYPRVIGSTGIEDEFTLERNTKKTECINYIRFTENDIRVSDDISVNGAIKELICSDIEFYCSDCTYSNGKLNVKGTAKVCMLLDMLQDGDGFFYETVTKNIPINHTADITLPEGTWCCFARIEKSAFECALANDSNGVQNVVEIDFSAKADVVAMSNEESIFTDDVYSTGYSYNNKYKTVETQKLIKCMNVNFTSYGTNELQMSEGENISKILLSSVEPERVTVEMKDTRVVFSGECAVKSVLQTSSGSYRNEEFVFPIRFETPIDTDGYLEFITNCTCIEHKTSVDGNMMNINAELGLNVAFLEKVSETTVESVAIDKSSPLEAPSEKVMILYYPEQNETLWSIAKKYGIQREVLQKINKLANTEELPRVLLIPTQIK